MYRDSAIMIIALVVPIALDKLADITNNSNKKSPDGQERGIFFHISERIIFLCGMIICPMTVFCRNKRLIRLSYMLVAITVN
jgi:hypothetical protein